VTVSRRNVLAAAGALAGIYPSSAFGQTPRRPERIFSGDDLTALHTADEGVEERFLGAPDARVTCVEYASLTCPHCASFHLEQLPRIKARFVDIGQVRLIFRHFLLTPQDAGASLMARAAPADRFFPIVERVFRDLRRWASAPDPVAALQEIAQQFGFTQESFHTALRNDALLDRLQDQTDRAEQRFGVDSTPTLFVNGQMYPGALEFAEFESVVAPMLRG
jgi:protein-disulfide isomerase